MNVTLSTGQTLHVSFVHSSHGVELRNFDEHEAALKNAGGTRKLVDNFAYETARRLTLCEIAAVTPKSDATGHHEEYFVLGQGWAVVHPNDKFTKTTGRKLALTKALQAADFDRDARAEVWQAYHNAF
jgi:hypothetical protein